MKCSTAHSMYARNAARNPGSLGRPASSAAAAKHSTKRCPRSDMSPLPACRPSSVDRWIRFGPDALLISRRNMAHIPGACDHFTEEWVLDPRNGWGWIPHHGPGTWDRISTNNPVIASRRYLQSCHSPLLRLLCQPLDLTPTLPCADLGAVQCPGSFGCGMEDRRMISAGMKIRECVS